MPGMRRQGVGQELSARAWDHCRHHLTHVETSVQAGNMVGRRFLETQGWVLASVQETRLFWLVKGERMIYRKMCRKSLDETL